MDLTYPSSDTVQYALMHNHFSCIITAPLRGASETEFEMSSFVCEHIGHNFGLDLAYLWLSFATSYDIRGELNVDRALFLSYKYHQKE